MKRVLLTGATGFIGRHCLVPLRARRDFEVHAVARGERHPDAEGVVWHQADLLDPQQVSRLLARVAPSHLLHLAWYAEPGRYWTHPDNLRWLQASLHLLLEFATHRGERVVMAGTCAEYDWRFGYCSESVTPLSPATLYGTCKRALQVTLDAYGASSGLSSAWGRIFFVFGPHEHPARLVPSVITSLLRGEHARCSHGNQIRDFLYVRDAADAFVALLESQVTGAVNIGSGEPVTLKSIVMRIAERLGRAELVRLGALPSPASEPPLLLADVTRLREEVGWRPNYSLDAGLDLTLQWWERQLAGSAQVQMCG
ncbi:MAG: NAD-dependent epimerase/dehydratase family protein [Longimicrobiaceae bacterium]